jgi:hypothetical protein
MAGLDAVVNWTLAGSRRSLDRVESLSRSVDRWKLDLNGPMTLAESGNKRYTPKQKSFMTVLRWVN